MLLLVIRFERCAIFSFLTFRVNFLTPEKINWVIDSIPQVGLTAMAHHFSGRRQKLGSLSALSMKCCSSTRAYAGFLIIALCWFDCLATNRGWIRRAFELQHLQDHFTTPWIQMCLQLIGAKKIVALGFVSYRRESRRVSTSWDKCRVLKPGILLRNSVIFDSIECQLKFIS